jgi:hypothetical protein
LVVRLTRPPTIRGSHKSLPRRVCVAVAPCSRRCDRLGAGFLVGVDPARHRAGTWSDLTRGGRSCRPPWSRLSGRHAGVDSRARGCVFRDLAADESDVWNAHERDPYCLDEHGQGGLVHCGHHPRHNRNVVAACWRKNARHDSRARSGAGGRPASISTLRTVVGETTTPMPLSSPTIRRYPQSGFSLARRRINAPMDGSSGGLPGFVCG